MPQVKYVHVGPSSLGHERTSLSLLENDVNIALNGLKLDGEVIVSVQHQVTSISCPDGVSLFYTAQIVYEGKAEKEPVKR